MNFTSINYMLADVIKIRVYCDITYIVTSLQPSIVSLMFRKLIYLNILDIIKHWRWFNKMFFTFFLFNPGLHNKNTEAWIGESLRPSYDVWEWNVETYSALFWNIPFHVFFSPPQYKADTLKTVQNLSEEHPMIDYTPPSLITLLFTDLGVLTPSAVSDELIKLYL